MESNIEIQKEQSNKRKITGGDFLINKSRKVCVYAYVNPKTDCGERGVESNPIDCTSIIDDCGDRIESNRIEYTIIDDCGDRIERGVESNPIEYTSIDDCGVGEGFWGTNLEKENSNLSLRIINSVKSYIRMRRENREIERGEMVDKQPEWKVKAIELNRIFGRITRIAGVLMSLNEPYVIFDRLDVKDMENLQEDIKVYLDLGKAPPLRKRYWAALLVICDWELARMKEAQDPARVDGELLGDEMGLHSSIQADLKNILEIMNYSDIEKLQSEIESVKFSGLASEVQLLKQHARIYKAKSFLKEEYAAILGY